MATGPGTCLRPCDAAELSELLQFLDDWLTAGHDDLHEPLVRFVGSPAYGISHLQDDIRRSRSSSAQITAPSFSVSELAHHAANGASPNDVVDTCPRRAAQRRQPFQSLRVEITVANVDRLLHHAHLVLTKSDSHRLAEAFIGKG